MRFQSIADTGTTLLLLPPKAAKDYYAQVPGAQSSAKEGGYAYPCDSKLPDLTLIISNVNLKIPATFLSRGASATGSGNCYGGVQQGADSLSIWGDIFLKSQFAVFDGRDEPRIGFAQQSIEVLNIGPSPALTANPPKSNGKTTPAASGAVGLNTGSQTFGHLIHLISPVVKAVRKLARSRVPSSHAR
jgi:hypothetical protein